MHTFDVGYYAGRHDVVRARIRDDFQGDALLDYVWVGSGESRSPSADFDEVFYLETNPDVAAALRSSDIVCGYHHYLKSGFHEGRRGIRPTRDCVIDAGPTPRSDGPPVSALASAIQRVRSGWRVQVRAGWSAPIESELHPLVEWTESRAGFDDANEAVRSSCPNYVVRLGGSTLVPPSNAATLLVGPFWAAEAKRTSVRSEVTMPFSLATDSADFDEVRSAQDIVVALETIEKTNATKRGSRIISRDKLHTIGTGLEIEVSDGDTSRSISLVVSLPPESGVSKELLVLESGAEPIGLDVRVNEPANVAVRVGAGAERIVVRPKKKGYFAASRIALARVDVTPVDLVEPPAKLVGALDALVVADLNADLSRVKRELGQFLTKADGLVRRRPAFEFSLPAVPRLAPVTAPRCLIVSTIEVEQSWVGRETVDVATWTEYFAASGFTVDVLALPIETADDVRTFSQQNLDDQRFVVLTSPRAGALLSDGFERNPNVVRIYRGAVSGGRTVEARLRDEDADCARAADRVLVEGPNDFAYYREAGVSAGRLNYVPEFLPAAFRRPVRPYFGRPRQIVIHVDTFAALDGRIRSHRNIRGAIASAVQNGWHVVISASPKMRSRIDADLELSAVRDTLEWCDPSLDMPRILHSTRIVLAPGLGRAEIAGLTTAARILGFNILLDEPSPGRFCDHVGVMPRGFAKSGVLKRLDRDPGALDMSAVRADAFRALDRVLGFRDAGWQEGRGDRSPDI